MHKVMSAAKRHQWAIGITAALFATMAWSLTFIVPSVIGDYSIFDFYLVNFSISGSLGVCFLAANTGLVRKLTAKDCLVACWLGWIGCLGYALALTGATINAGPVITPAFLALVPVVLGIAGNLRQRTASWRHLALPLTLATAGLLMVNCNNGGSIVAARSLAVGIPLAILAVFLWVWFGIWNHSALGKRREMDAVVWVSLMMCGAAIGMLGFLPFGLRGGLFEFPRLGLHWKSAASLYIWAALLAVLVNIAGGFAWAFASKQLPVVLAAQLITMEPTFGTVFGLSIRRRWPTVAEGVGMILLVAGVVFAVQLLYGRSEKELPSCGS